MKRTLTILLLLFTLKSFSQQSGNLVVEGDIDKYYPVVFSDIAWTESKATELNLGRSDVHSNSPWRGSLIATFRCHTTRWGHGSRFVDADIQCSEPFIAGWKDATVSNITLNNIIWLKGGGTTYAFSSNHTVNPIVYDGVHNALPFHEDNGRDHTYKTAVENYVNRYGTSSEGSAFFLRGEKNYFASNVDIGTINPSEKLSVNGNIRAREIKVEASNWPDFVFEDTYTSMPLSDVETFIKKNKHLPDIPSANEVNEKGVRLGEFNAKLLTKIEELTLYLIEKTSTYKILKNGFSKSKVKLINAPFFYENYFNMFIAAANYSNSYSSTNGLICSRWRF
jgi:hypothetical protein